jgi:hypothetical protein
VGWLTHDTTVRTRGKFWSGGYGRWWQTQEGALADALVNLERPLSATCSPIPRFCLAAPEAAISRATPTHP